MHLLFSCSLQRLALLSLCLSLRASTKLVKDWRLRAVHCVVLILELVLAVAVDDRDAHGQPLWDRWVGADRPVGSCLRHG